MNQTFWVGVYPGLDTDKLDHVCKCISTAMCQRLSLAR
jgi:hypothetical protein